MDCRTALLTILDQVDYTNGACGVTEMVGAVLSKEVIALARKAIVNEAIQPSAQSDVPPIPVTECDHVIQVNGLCKCHAFRARR